MADKNKTTRERLREDLAAIYIGNLNTVETDLTLPLRGENGSDFRWETGESRFINTEGKVYRPLHGMGNRKVVLTVTGSLEGETDQRVFEATVLQEARENIVKSILPVTITGEAGMIQELPSVVVVTCEDGRVMTMPVSWETTPTIPDEGEEMRVFGSLKETKLRPVAILTAGRKKQESGPTAQLRWFPLSAVRLQEGSWFMEAQLRMNEWLLSVNDDQMLYNFRKACGLSVKGAPPMTGWDEDSCKLKGHTTGHYLSGLALAWAATGQERFLEKITYMVDSLAECQEAFARSGRVHDGFLSAYDEGQFDLLEKFTKYPEIWAPYYTLDKIMSGLYDCHTLAGNARALEIEEKMGDWVYARLSRLPKETLDRMWSMYIAGEFGGMLGTMVKLYGLTRRPEHLKAALLFSNEKLFFPMEQGVDTLEDMHANQHIPQIMGAMDLYTATGDVSGWKIGKNFWEIVTRRHTYCVGGVGETEMFHAPFSTTRFLTDKAAESCASYNLLRLTGQIFPYVPEGRLMDYYENTLINHLLTSFSHEADGGTTYFLPLGPGGRKVYSTTENTCCHGTGMESRYRYMEQIFAWNGEAVYVNLPVPAVLTGEIPAADRAESIRLAVHVPEEGWIAVRLEEKLDRKLRLHIPAWAQDKLRVFRGSRELRVGTEVFLQEGYLEVPGGFSAGEEIRLQLPMEVRILENESDSSFVNLAYGPWILAGISEKETFLPLPGKPVRAAGREPLFTAGDMKMIPLARVDREAYHTYWKR